MATAGFSLHAIPLQIIRGCWWLWVHDWAREHSFIPLFSPVGHGEQVLIIANVKPCACIFPANTRQIPALVSTGTSVLGGSHPYWPEAVLLVVAFLWTGPPDHGWTENSLILSHKMRVPDRTLFCHFNNWKLWFSWPRGHLIWRQERKGVHQHYGSVT